MWRKKENTPFNYLLTYSLISPAYADLRSNLIPLLYPTMVIIPFRENLN